MSLIRSGIVVALLIASFAVTACGQNDRSEQAEMTPVEQARADTEAATQRTDDLNEQLDEISASTDAASDEASRLRGQALDLIESGDVEGGMELNDKADAITDEANPGFQERERLLDEVNEALDQQSKAQAQLEELLGCDRECRKERNRMVNLNTNCMVKATNLGVPVNRAIKECDKKFPVPAASEE